jgi:heptaprenyl diphosphate synthase
MVNRKTRQTAGAGQDDSPGQTSAPNRRNETPQCTVRPHPAALPAALCLFLAALEYLIPRPLPFMRLGLANLPILAVLSIPADSTERSPAQNKKPPPLFFSPKNYCLLVLLKIAGQALITGSVFSYVFLFSLAGSAASAFTMYALRRAAGSSISLAGTGAAGGFVSNAAQLLLARFFIFGTGTAYLAPPFLAAGILSGALLGIFAQTFAEKSQWLGAAGNQAGTNTAGPVNEVNEANADLYRQSREKGDAEKSHIKKNPGFVPVLIITLAAAAFILVPLPAVKTSLCAAFAAAAILTGKKIRPLACIAFMAGIIACNLFPPAGKIVFQAGPFIVAQESLHAGIFKAIQFEGLFMLSKLVTPYLSLPGSFGRTLQETFRILEELTLRKDSFFFRKTPAQNPGAKSFMERLDTLLLELSEHPQPLRQR